MSGKLGTLLDHTTDVAGIAALAYLGANGEASAAIVGAIATISLGKRYAEVKQIAQ